VLELDLAKQYCRGETARARAKGDFVILEFLSENEAVGDGSDDGSGWLSSLISLRADLAGGDYRMLYLAWLNSAQVGELDDDVLEPPVPPGLGTPTGSLKAFEDFLRLDPDLLAVAAVASTVQAEPPSDPEIARWVTALPETEKTAWLLRLALGQEAYLRMELLKTLRASQGPVGQPPGPSRSVGQLLDAAQQHAEARKRNEAERAALERRRREQEAAAAREKYLAILAKRVPETWGKVDALIATKRPGDYDTAVQLLKDLAELGEKNGLQAEVREQLARLRQEHARKPTLITRLRAAGLIAD
jgi:hypothetical protein